MLTFQDFEALGEDEGKRKDFILQLINEHKSSEDYKIAEMAEEYDRKKNTTIMQYRKWLYDKSGKQIPDNYSANYKLPSGFFPRFITQLNQYLLGNGVVLEKENKEKLGETFDIKLQRLGRSALVEKVAFGFWNFDHLEVFKFLEFAPLYDEETGALRAGVRFWQIATDKPMRMTLFEQDGYTEYLRDGGEVKTKEEKRAYIQTERKSEIEREISGENYSGFPIIPLCGNSHHQSELVGIQYSIDCYDLIKSGFANDLDEASMIYWIIKNAGGMDTSDIAEFLNQLKLLHGATVDGDANTTVEAHTTEVPYEARKAYLEQLRNDMYDDFQIVNVSQLSPGQKTATEINAAYEPQNNKTDEYEYCVLEFLDALFKIVGIEDTPKFVRSKIVNQQEETETVMLAAEYLDDETILKHLPWLTSEEVDEILKRKSSEELGRMGVTAEE